ncbi:MAG: hypothetical protein GY796_30310 [Chloroflexi bacterium]|nr:hypothetical protein [Chloroflexota bacterium]
MAFKKSSMNRRNFIKSATALMATSALFGLKHLQISEGAFAQAEQPPSPYGSDSYSSQTYGQQPDHQIFLPIVTKEKK